MVTPIRLYPLYCTLNYCTLTLTITHWQPSALVALSFAFVSDFVSRFRLEINNFFSNSFFLLEVSRELPQCSTLNTHSLFVFFHCSFEQFSTPSHIVVSVILTLFALTILCVSHSNLHLIFVLFQTCFTFVNSSILLPYSGFQFLFFLGRVPIKP